MEDTEDTQIFDSWLTNNDEPPDQVVRDVQNLLEKPAEERECLDVEIQLLITQLGELRAQRAKVDNIITRYKAIASPIRRVPADVLREIFLYCLDEHRNPLMLTNEAPVLLTRICSSWRAIALSFPLLWCRIHIAFTDQDLLPNIVDPLIDEAFMGPPRLPRPRIIGILRLRCEAVEEWLRRSGTCSLSISVHYTKHQTANTAQRRSDLTQRLFKSLVRESSRWTHVELSMPLDIYSILAETFGETAFTNLVTLRVTAFEKSNIFFDHRTVPVDPPPFELIAPNLKRYSVHFSQTSLPKITSPWETLTYLSVHSHLSLSEASSLLKKCSHLVHLKILLPSSQPNFNGIFGINVAQPTRYQDSYLPELRSLHIKIEVNDILDPAFFDSIIAPQLKVLSYRSSIPVQRITTPGPALPSHRIFPPICALLLKSNQLKRLTIDMHNYLSSEIITILESASSVTHLIFGSQQPAYGASGNLPTHWDFGAVFLTGSDAPLAVPLLPNLKVLEFVGKSRVAGLSDKSLLELIIRRTNPSPSSPFATLRHVRAVINGKPQLNIPDELRRHLQGKGLATTLTLQLSYTGFGHVANSALATSPALGLAQRLAVWNNDRADEDLADWAVASGNSEE